MYLIHTYTTSKQANTNTSKVNIETHCVYDLLYDKTYVPA